MNQHEHHDEADEYGFWANMPERRFSLPRLRTPRPATPERPPRPARPERPAPASAPVAAARSTLGHVDPLIRRSGTLALILTLFVPVAMALRSGDQPHQAASLQPEAAVASLAASSPTPSAPADPFASIDIAALPEAVPVNQPAAEAPDPAPASASNVAAAPAAAAAAPAPTANAEPAPVARTEQAPSQRASCSRTYTVAAGDAWVLIAKKVGVTTKALLAANNATRRTTLFPGRTVCLPKGAAAPASTPSTTTTPAAPPTTVAATVPSKPVNTYSKAQVEQIIREVWPDELEDHAVFIASRESHLTPNVNNFCCYGLFQIYYNVHKKWLAQIGVTSAAQLWDPRVNAYAALVLYNRSGSFAPWGG